MERLGATGADVVGLDWTADMADARKRLGNKSVQVRKRVCNVQCLICLLNDPAVLLRHETAIVWQCRSHMK
jgi:uroporphyrinogen-III decarboxylase